MEDMVSRFAGSVPASYDSLMVPFLFRPYAEELARRAGALGPDRILETAAGTGAVTQALRERLPNAAIIATDLNPPMLDMAAHRIASPKVEFRVADAQQLLEPPEREGVASLRPGIDRRHRKAGAIGNLRDRELQVEPRPLEYLDLGIDEICVSGIVR